MRKTLKLGALTAALIASVAFMQPTLASETSAPPVGSPVVDEQGAETTRIVTEWYEVALNGGRPDLNSQYVHEWYIQHNILMEQGLEGLNKFYGMLHGMFPDFQAVTHKTVAQGDTVALLNTFTGHHYKTGQELRIDVIDIYRVQDGKIAEHWDTIDYTFAMKFGFRIPAVVQPADPIDWNGTPLQKKNVGVALDFVQGVFNPGPAWNAETNRYVHPNLVNHQPGVGDGRDAFKANLARYHQQFPDLTVSVNQVVAANDAVFVFTVWRGHRASDGKELVLSRGDIFQVKGNMMVEHWSAIEYHTLLAGGFGGLEERVS